QIEGWYNSPTNPHPAQGARVQVFRPSGERLVEGELDREGFFVFSPALSENLKVVVYQVGHRGEVTIPSSALALPPAASDSTPAGGAARQPDRPPPGGHPPQDWVKDILTGVGFVLALA